MPLYEYTCPECGVFEVMQKFSDAELCSCPKCKESGKENAVKKLISSPAIHFKGTGWYKTDYSNNSNSAASSGKSAAAESSSTEKKDSLKTVSAGGCGSGCACH